MLDYSPWRTITLVPSQDVPRKPNAHARFDLLIGKRSGATVAATEMWRRHRLLDALFPTKTYRVCHRAGVSPALAYPRHVYQTIRTSIEFLHAAIPTLCDERQIIRARVQDRKQPKDVHEELVVHFTPSAWTNRRPDRKAQARKEWKRGQANVLAIVRENIRADRPTRICGDWNFKGKPLGRKINGCRVQYISNGIDMIILVDSPTRKWEVDAASRKVRRGKSDHKIISIRTRIRIVGKRR